MILELDCGNSFIKWRVITDLDGSLITEGVAGHVGDLIQDVLAQGVGGVARCRLVSVRNDAETAAIEDTLTGSLGISVSSARPSRSMAGVINGYRDNHRLGLDRWLAIIAAYNLCQGACVVVDLGTAITVDLVSPGGEHLGGYIAPGVALLRAQLLAHTRRIHYDAAEAEAALSEFAPGRDTAEAVERGCLLMARSYVSSQIGLAKNHLGQDAIVYVTGGDAALAADLSEVRCVPDLVFRGLAIACP